MPPEIKAIPTEYNGQQYRSRLEADTALLFDLLNIPFAYESKSFLLPSGTHYRPDFKLWGDEFYVEVRGYESEKGDRQISEFCDFVVAGGLGDDAFYGVIRLGAGDRYLKCGAVRDVSRATVGIFPTWNFFGPGTGMWGTSPGYRYDNMYCIRPLIVDGVLHVQHRDPVGAPSVLRISDLARQVAEYRSKA